MSRGNDDDDDDDDDDNLLSSSLLPPHVSPLQHSVIRCSAAQRREGPFNFNGSRGTGDTHTHTRY